MKSRQNKRKRERHFQWLAKNNKPYKPPTIEFMREVFTSVGNANAALFGVPPGATASEVTT